MHHLAVMQQTQNTESEESWEFNKSFKQECVYIKLLQLHEDFSLTIYGYNEGEERRFSYEPMEFISVTELVEQLLINGIAVPSADKSYSLQFYKRCHRGVYPYTPPHIQLGFDTSSEPSTKNFPEDLKKFWDCLHSFFLTLIIHLDNSDTLPRDPQFPLAEAARANHKRILEEIDEYSDHIGQEYQKITSEEWGNLFDEEGRIKNFEEFKLRLFHAGIDTEILNKALPFAFGVYPSNSTTIEREKLDKELSKEYKQLVNQVEKLTPDQINNNKRISSAFRVIKHDVSRTDRQLLAFKDNDAEGLKMVTQLLRTYCIFNPPIGYLQGMNDLFVPILLAFLPRWDEKGYPINENNERIEYEEYYPSIFWCFDAMLHNIDHLKLLANVTEQCKKQAETIFQIICKVSPLAAIWMRRNSLKELLWCYSDFVLLFKRSFSDIWSVWLQLNCSPCPQTWLAYFVAAIIVQGFNELAQITDVNITTMMDKFPKIMSNIPFHKIGKTSLWLADKVPPTIVNRNEEIDDNKEFLFFETEWTGPCKTTRENKK